MFIALSTFTIANNMAEEVRAAFCNRLHLVDNSTGFLGMEVMSPIDNHDEVWLLTRWSDEQSYQSWHNSHKYDASHKGIPKGLKLVPGSAKIKLFEVFAA
ncbi:MAG: antibiotic biosynthesis monooxygenase [Gammaproteobacteria bacterium]|nr:antibiotic biosynthesis monooxygenase [Gammaproteobacteria bacterium]MBU1624215.1 antibiotic biosynthesis monooxygenase [Gammaproteobacteria bacterium]MBU1981943.1 antibiotic biosynthesis monooxygenase [Gammaproteobacteria bacterium]